MTQTTNASFYSQVLAYRSAPILPDYHSASILPFHTGSSQEYLLYSWITFLISLDGFLEYSALLTWINLFL